MPVTSAGMSVPAKVLSAIWKVRGVPGVNWPAAIGVPLALKPVVTMLPCEGRVSTTRTGGTNARLPRVAALPGDQKPTTSTSTSAWLVVKIEMLPAPVPSVGTRIVQKLWAVAVEGLTVEALGGPGRSLG